MNFYKATTIALAASTAVAAGYALHLEGLTDRKNTLLIQSAKTIDYLSTMLDRHKVPVDEFDVIALKEIISSK